MSSGLADRSLNAAKWNYLGVSARIGSQLLVQVVLSRLLGPQAFGLFAGAFLVIGIGGILTEMGLGSALVQPRELSDETIRSAFTLVLAAGLATATSAFLLGAGIRRAFPVSSVGIVVQGMAPALLAQATGIVSQALLKRELDFRAIQTAFVASYIIGFAVTGVSLALAGAGVWSLVGAYTVQVGLFSLLTYRATRHPARLYVPARRSRLRTFGMKALGVNLANWAIENVDNLLVGWLFGVRALGLYSVSYNLVRAPANHLMVTLQAVLFPASAIAQDDARTLRRGYTLVISAVVLIAAPVFVGIASIPDTVVQALFGPRWSDASSILRPLALAMVLHVSMTGSVILWATDQVEREGKIQRWIAAILIVSLVLAARVSLLAVGWAVFGVYLLRAGWMARVLLRALELSWATFFAAIRGGIALAGATSVSVLVLDHSLRSAGVSAAPRLVCAAATGALVTTTCAVLFRHFVVHDLLHEVVQGQLSRWRTARTPSLATR